MDIKLLGKSNKKVDVLLAKANVDPDLRDLIKRTLEVDPERRIKAGM